MKKSLLYGQECHRQAKHWSNLYLFLFIVQVCLIFGGIVGFITLNVQTLTGNIALSFLTARCHSNVNDRLNRLEKGLYEQING